MSPGGFHPTGPARTPPATSWSSAIRWSSVEAMEAALGSAGLPLQLLQLDGGQLHGDAVAVGVGPLRLLRLRLDRRMHSWGPKPAGMLTLSLDLEPQAGDGTLLAHGQILPRDAIFGLDCQREVHVTVNHAGITMGVVMIPIEQLAVWVAELGGGELDPASLRLNWLRLDPRSCEGLRGYLRQVFNLAEHQPARLASPSCQRQLLEDFLPLMLEALVVAANPAGRQQKPPARFEIVRAAQGWLHAHPDHPITLADLCRQAHAGRRSLIQGFREQLGMGPMAYLKVCRLHAVRRLLLAAEPERLRIGPLAAEWGFLNAGHFARDYRLLFGEKPSETLRRPNRGVSL